MSNTKKADPFRRLLKWTIVLLVLFALLATGFVLMDKYQKGERDVLAQRVEEENKKMVEDYNKALAAQQAGLQTGEVITWPEPAESGWDVLDVSAFPLDHPREEQVTRADLLKGGLLLVNRWHEMPGDFTLVEGELASIGMETSYRVPVADATVRLLPSAIAALDTLIADAKEAGLEHYIMRSGYRDAQTQLGYWQDEVARFAERYAGDALTEKAREQVAFPGTSDYHTGLSVNIDVYNRNDSALNATSFQQTAQAKWLNEHAWEYGFVFRFPVQGYPDADTVDKAYKTGINLKMDTYRYVGIPHAAVMRHLGFSLEEYIDYLIAHPHLAVYLDGVLKYEIYRTAGGTTDSTVTLPSGAKEFTASTDNMDGLVVAAIIQ